MDKSVEKIFSLWEQLGVSKKPGNLVTHRDINQVSLEMRTISKLLNAKDVLLDIGCGNGFTTSIHAKKCLKTIGIDYSKNMIAAAKKTYENRKLHFEVGDALTLNYKKGAFTTIISTRCLINLTSWNKQKRAIFNLAETLDSGGKLILTEGIRQGRKNLNQLRQKLGLNPMPDVWHNLDFDEDKLLPLLGRYFILQQDIRFGLYDVLTRAFYPAGIYPRQPKYGTPFHSAAEKLTTLIKDQKDLRKYSREACLVLIKK